MKSVSSSLNSSALPTIAVAAPVCFVDHVREVTPRRSAAVRRMIGFAESPEQMLDPIGRIEQAVEKPRSKRLELVQHHRLTITPGDFALIEKRLFRDSLVVQPRMILDHPGRVIKADPRRQISGDTPEDR